MSDAVRSRSVGKRMPGAGRACRDVHSAGTALLTVLSISLISVYMGEKPQAIKRNRLQAAR